MGTTLSVGILVACIAVLCALAFAVRRTGQSPLARAIHAGNAEHVTLLLRTSADPNSEVAFQGYRGPAFMAAIAGGDARVVQAFLDHGCDLNASYRLHTIVERTEFEERPLGQAIDLALSRKVGVDFVRFLVDRGARVDGPDADAYLFSAFKTYNKGIVDLLLRHGADVNALVESEGAPLLHDAVEDDDTEMVEHLLAHGAEVDKPDENGRTAFIWAACLGLDEMVELLLEHGAQVNARDHNGRRALFYVTNPEEAAMLVENDPESGPEGSDAPDHFPRMAALLEGHGATL